MKRFPEIGLYNNVDIVNTTDVYAKKMIRMVNFVLRVFYRNFLGMPNESLF